MSTLDDIRLKDKGRAAEEKELVDNAINKNNMDIFKAIQAQDVAREIQAQNFARESQLAQLDVLEGLASVQNGYSPRAYSEQVNAPMYNNGLAKRIV